MSSIMREYPTTVTKEQAMNVIRNHGYDTVDISDFLFVCGDAEVYSLQALRDWLGY